MLFYQIAFDRFVIDPMDFGQIFLPGWVALGGSEASPNKETGPTMLASLYKGGKKNMSLWSGKETKHVCQSEYKGGG